MNPSPLHLAAERLVPTLPTPAIASLREVMAARDVPPGALVIMAEADQGFALALHLPDGQGFMFCFGQQVDPSVDDLAEPTRLWPWGVDAPDEPTLVLARDLSWADVAAILDLDPATVPPPRRRIGDREFAAWIDRFIQSLQGLGDRAKGRALRLAQETRRIVEDGSTPGLDLLVFVNGFHHLAGDLGADAVNELARVALNLVGGLRLARAQIGDRHVGETSESGSQFGVSADRLNGLALGRRRPRPVARAAVLRGALRASQSGVEFRATDVEVDELLAPFAINRRARAANCAPKQVRRSRRTAKQFRVGKAGDR